MDYSSDPNIDSAEFLLTNSKLNPDNMNKILTESAFQFSWNSRKASELIAEINQFYKLNFQDPYNEYILNYNYSPLMWIAESPVNKAIYNFYRQNYPRINGTDAHKQIVDLYKKWIMQESESERKYLASSLINLSERNLIKNNFLMMILSGMVFLFDSNFKNIERARNNFEKTLDIIHSIKLKDELQNEIQYLVKLNLAYLYLLQSDYLTAREKFLEIVIEHYHSVNARFHLLFTDIKLNNFDNLNYILTEIIEYDKSRFIASLTKNSSTQLIWIMKNSVFDIILKDPNLMIVHSLLKDLISEQINETSSTVEKLLKNIKSFHTNFSIAESDANLIEPMSILSEIAEYQTKLDAPVYYFVVSELELKFKTNIQAFINSISYKYQKNVEEKLITYDIRINELASVADKSAEANKVILEKLSEKLQANLKKIEDKLVDESSILEQHLERISEEMNLTPRSSFSNTMIYNTIISFMVFVMSGCVGYTSKYVSDVSQLSELLLSSIISGFKWGITAFFIGVIVSLLSAGLAYIDKANKKQKLIQKLKDLKIEKEFVCEKLKKDFELNKSKLSEELNEELNLIKEQIDKIKLEKDDKRVLLEKEAEEQIQKETAHLVNYLK